MSKENKIKVGISIGDLNGIGIEVILKTFSDKRMLDFCTPIIFGSTKVISFYKKDKFPNIQIQSISNCKQAVEEKFNVLNVWKDDVDISVGESNETGGKYAFLSLKECVNALKKGFVDFIVTAPINKENIQSEEFKFAGHTEYLENELEGESLMILMANNLRVGLITGHIPISEVAKSITPKLIKNKVELMYNTLIRDFEISKPKIAILGLNPHCGDNGVIGSEDDTIIRPTIQEIQEEGKLVYGPYAADGFFGSETYKQYDAILAMYHDQGLAPFKTLSFGKGVNYTAGLNKVRTSPDHGTAYEIAGKNIADENSFKEALFKGIEIYKKRTNYELLTENSLKKTKQQ
ncbi:4-hydroxythreonine-4-phosphate dehydrogenase PdxA [Urechidicola croceus]|uniref:4-hydroxythreonine-4-phosphate dehydrogenase PdxA n=1 Tax=Urechidicola croceus TaxID=1850246 RepID=A0A1D8PA48_9FLAO|nr:4-hydroxythreonine-4-phosphate dehydrogenase PdxA [Urechidicola croceus]AOW21443.1 4-hydroxythreonine-4-phosphate dehydrogenase PdxA [Urechidicola croceus]